MQLSRLSILVLIASLTACASPTTSREEAEAAAILSRTAEVAGETQTAEEISEETRKAQMRANIIAEANCAIAIPCPKYEKYGNAPSGTVISNLWWTFKYAAWGQGSSKDWPWAW
jgi:hypothetical protein